MFNIKLSRKSEYACLALIFLARSYDQNSPIKLIDICKQQDIPKKYLEQIMLILKNAGYVQSIRGVGGGYKLFKHPSSIHIAEIVRLIDGPVAPVDSVSKYYYASTPTEKEPKLLSLFQDIRDYISDILENTTLEDLM